MNKRILTVFTIIIVTFLAASAKILLVINDKTYTVGINNSSKAITIGTIRGTIFDCNGKRLTNGTYEYIAAVPPTAQAIKSVVKYNLTDNQRKKLLSGYPVAVTVDKYYSCDGVQVFKIPKRYSGIASHLIGYCDSENEGLCGIEKSYNDILKGKTVKVSFKTDVNGKVLINTQTVENSTGYSGNGVKLTLDRDIQEICEQTAKKHIKRGAVVVLENSTGKIKGLCSLPDYDPENVEDYIDSDSSPFFNRALAAYNCGSVFKLCTAASALDNGISPNAVCNGFVKIGKNKFNCLSKHGKVSLADAISESCNSYFVQLGQSIGGEQLYRTAKNLGFGIPYLLASGVLSESGTLPDIEYLKKTPAELANFSFGQGRLMATPLQIASMIQCIANNGKLYHPRLFEGITNSSGKVVSREDSSSPTFAIKSNSAKYLQKCMIKTVTEGTGKTANPYNCTAGGKTATAQTGIYDEDGKAVFQTWFGGFFPGENPKYTVVVLCENGNSGSKSAAPVFREIVEKITEINK